MSSLSKETEGSYVIEADLPGVKEGELDVTLEQNRLSITGKRSAETRKEGESYHLFERRYGSFTRTFSLPRVANADGIVARLDAGVLTVSVPKRAEAKARKIPIK